MATRTMGDPAQRELGYRKRLIEIANLINSAPSITEILVDIKDKMLERRVMSIGAAAARQVREHFGWQQVAEQFAAACAATVEQVRRRQPAGRAA